MTGNCAAGERRSCMEQRKRTFAFLRRGVQEGIMRKEFLPFTRPAITESDIQAVTEVLRSGWLTNGPRNQELEHDICELSGSRFGVALGPIF